jgi:hypothetical protein
VPCSQSPPLDGRCTCGGVRFRLHAAPLIVHCCHCRWCQRETGSAFVINALIETDRVQLLAGAPELVDTPSESGRGQRIARCPHCHVALWSHYAGLGAKAAFVRAGTLDSPEAVAPDVHIFTASKLPWVALPPGVPAFAEFYDRDAVWPADALARRAALLAR